MLSCITAYSISYTPHIHTTPCTLSCSTNYTHTHIHTQTHIQTNTSVILTDERVGDELIDRAESHGGDGASSLLRAHHLEEWRQEVIGRV